jgi:adenine/guanine phosphoribosyltransferase-like PRPP-binding protein
MEIDLKIALRDSAAASRPYVVLNPLLAKHIPVSPKDALAHFKRLGAQVAATCAGERTLVIGFAETATAVGAAVAACIERSVYVHTTREVLASERLVAEFLEEHSHAKNQALYLSDDVRDLSAYDRIVFVEDEITTGKTILNFLRRIDYRGKITVSALVFNGFDERAFAGYPARFCCIRRIPGIVWIEIDALPDPRAGVVTDVYATACRSAAETVAARISERSLRGKDVLVLGTEEFMYPALVLGERLERVAKTVKTHATTRSPLAARENDRLYPLTARHAFKSPYDADRTTYLYNLETYDAAIVFTDAPRFDSDELLRILQMCGNFNIYFVRSRNADSDR